MSAESYHRYWEEDVMKLWAFLITWRNDLIGKLIFWVYHSFNIEWDLIKHLHTAITCDQTLLRVCANGPCYFFQSMGIPCFNKGTSIVWKSSCGTNTERQGWSIGGTTNTWCKAVWEHKLLLSGFYCHDSEQCDLACKLPTIVDKASRFIFFEMKKIYGPLIDVCTCNQLRFCCYHLQVWCCFSALRFFQTECLLVMHWYDQWLKFRTRGHYCKNVRFILLSCRGAKSDATLWFRKLQKTWCKILLCM